MAMRYNIQNKFEGVYEAFIINKNDFQMHN